MKELKEMEATRAKVNEEIRINPYLTYAEIQAICSEVNKFDNWADREQTLDILLLHYATNLTDKEIGELDHIKMLKSGLIDEVKNTVKNFNRIQEAIDYTQSTQRALAQIVKQLPEIMAPLKKAVKNANKSSKK